ncbi:MAG: hypothetical protein AAB423_03820 [Patescibacteria group bacterium]
MFLGKSRKMTRHARNEYLRDSVASATEALNKWSESGNHEREIAVNIGKIPRKLKLGAEYVLDHVGIRAQRNAHKGTATENPEIIYSPIESVAQNIGEQAQPRVIEEDVELVVVFSREQPQKV